MNLATTLAPSPIALSVISLETTRNQINFRTLVNTSFIFTFNEAIQKGIGFITITGQNGVSFLKESIDSQKIKIEGNKLTFTPSIELTSATFFTIQLSTDSVKNLDGSSSLSSGWSSSFSTDFSAKPLNIIGTALDDFLIGGFANDTIHGGSDGSDRINGYDGDDLIYGGDESNYFYRGDALSGDNGNDTIRGNAGDDTIQGGAGNDVLFGDDGRDSIEGGSGDDEIDGGAGDDVIIDREGHKNILRGGAGNDIIQTNNKQFGIQGIVEGGDGDDRLDCSVFDTVNGDAGNDTFNIWVIGDDSSVGKFNGGSGDDEFRFFSILSGSTGAEIAGGEGVDTYVFLNHSARNENLNVVDFQVGLGGDKIDLGVLKRDYFTGNPFSANGNLKLTQNGADTLLQRINNAGTTYQTTETILRLKNVLASTLSPDNFVGGYNPNGSSQGLTIIGTSDPNQLNGDSLDDTIYGGAGSDQISGRAGNDRLYGEAGDDTLRGEDGNDFLDGGDGNDDLMDYHGNNTLIGGAGNDRLRSNSAYESLLDGGEGNDTITSNDDSKVVLLGKNGDDLLNIFLSYDSKIQTIQADGGAGKDTIFIEFNALNKGQIELTGGAESDTFIIKNQGKGSLTITDFSTSDGDVLDLRGCLAGSIQENPFGKIGFFKIRQSGSDSIISIDIDGSENPAYTFRDFITLKNVNAADLKGLNFSDHWNPDGSSVGITLNGTPNNDKLTGTDLDDIFYGLAGTDNITGAAGNDVLYGGDDGDTLQGGIGNDTLFGENGDDRLNGGAGADSLDGGDGNDDLSDVEGNNSLFGGAGNDKLTSSNGNSTLSGGLGNDVFYLNAYPDNISAAISVSISGGEGDDKVYISSRRYQNTIFASGGTGIDTYVFSNQPTSQTNLIINDFEVGANCDVLDLTNVFPYMAIKVGENPFGTLGFLRLQQLGADTIVEYDLDGAIGKNHGFTPLVTLKNVQSDTLRPSNFAQNFNPNGSNEGFTLNGTSIADKLVGAQFDDTIHGMAGNDTIWGGDGADQIFGDEGDDVLNDGEGDDLLDGGEGRDQLIAEHGNNVLLGGAGDDTLTSSSTSKNLLKAGDGDDTIIAGRGNDTILGENGNDRITIYNQYYGTELINTIYADGGDGHDSFNISFDYRQKTALTVNGGLGRDIYNINTPVENSTFLVLDFKTGEGGDFLDFTNLLKFHVVRANPFGNIGWLRAIQVGNDTTIQWDSDGSTGTAQYKDVITLKNVEKSTLTSANIIRGYSPDGSNKGSTVLGTEKNDHLSGDILDDIIYGYAGNDVIFGGLGDDILDGGDGDDSINDSSGSTTVDGGNGNDNIVIDGISPSFIQGGDGNDSISVIINDGIAEGGNGDDYFFTRFTPNEQTKHELKLFGGNGNDYFSVSSDAANQQIVHATGGSGRDRFSINYNANGSSFIIEDFQVGENGDTIGIYSLFSSNVIPIGYIDKLFSDGYLRFNQTGSDTELLFNRDGNYAQNRPIVLVTLKGVLVSTIVTQNLAEFLNPLGGTTGVKLTGTDDSETIRGGLIDDTLLGGKGNDILEGWGGADYIDGGEGVDTALYSLAFFNYEVQKIKSTFVVTAKDYGIEQIDGLVNVEKLKFKDVTIDLTIKEHAKSINPANLQSLIELYIAFFNRVPDADGMTYWINEIKSGKSLNQISDAFYGIGASEQFSKRTGFTAEMSNKDFIDTFYKNVLGRADGADEGGLNYWSTKLANGTSTRSSLAIDILTAAHSFKGNAQFGYVADLLDNKVSVGQKLAIDWGITFNNDVYARSIQIANAITPTDITKAIGLIGISETDMAFML